MAGCAQKLQSGSILEDRRSCKVKVTYQDRRGKTGVITACLDDESYAEAAKAYKDGVYISLSGTIPEGSKVMDCTSFSVMPV